MRAHLKKMGREVVWNSSHFLVVGGKGLLVETQAPCKYSSSSQGVLSLVIKEFHSSLLKTLDYVMKSLLVLKYFYILIWTFLVNLCCNIKSHQSIYGRF